MAKHRKSKRSLDAELNAKLKTLARQYGCQKLQNWFFVDDPPSLPMPLWAYVRMSGTARGYSKFIRDDAAQAFVCGFPRLPGWLMRDAEA